MRGCATSEARLRVTPLLSTPLPLLKHLSQGGSVFLVLRQGAFDTVQCCFFKKDFDDETEAKTMLNYFKGLTAESVVDVYGGVVEADVRSCR